MGPTGLVAQYLSLLSAPLVALLFYKRMRIASLFVLLCLMVSLFIIGRSRQPVVMVALLFILYGLRRSLISFVIIFFMMVIFINQIDAIMGFLKSIRNLPTLADRVDFILSPGLWLIGSSGEGTIRYIFYTIVGNDGIGAAGGQLQYMARVALFWLPSFLDAFALKPADFEYEIFAATMGGREGTMHPTVFGSIYVDALRLFPIWVVFLAFLMYSIELFIR